MKLETFNEDLEKYGDMSYITVSDFTFRFVDKSEVTECRKVKAFIERYEWLGKMPIWITHRFVAYYKDILVGVIVMATPNTFSNLLGKEYRNREKLISRGASISFAPHNTASWMIMKSIKWMVKNTDFVLFTSYADPDARELGTIYQSCNFYYLGQKYGGGYVYYDPQSPDTGWVGCSYFNQRGTIKRIAIQNGVEWKSEYIKLNNSGRKRIINWDAMSDSVKDRIKAIIKDRRDNCVKVKTTLKHKYVYILGSNKGETRKLRKLFEKLNPKLEYPDIRGK